MLGRPRKLISGARGWLGRNWRPAAAIAVVAAVLAGTGVYLASRDASDPEIVEVAGPAPAPEVVIREQPAPEEPDKLGFPEFATKNTTRVAGPDPIADAAGVALAVYPSTGEIVGPDAVTLVDTGEWAAAIAAASLAAEPVGAPILFTDDGEMPALTAAALRSLGPAGSKATGGDEAFVVGGAAEPTDLKSSPVEGSNPADLAAAIAALRVELAGEPRHVVLVSADEPALAMPAASWAARSGDPILYVDRDRVPAATRDALERFERLPAYVLGPESAISEKAFDEVRELVPAATRIGADGPAESSVEFARYASGNFGWDINDPGHGFVLANSERPLDAGAAAPLSASGTWGPLLVTDDAAALPAALSEYLLDLKPGYLDDPTRAVYNHVWLIGDTAALSVDLQAQVDELAEVAQVTSGEGAELGPPPGTPENQPDEPAPQNDRDSDR